MSTQGNTYARQTTEALIEDLRAEQDSLLGVLRSRIDGWSVPTLADGWTVGDAVAHLEQFEQFACLALRDPAGFREERDAVINELDHLLASGVQARRAHAAELTLAQWAGACEVLTSLARSLPPTTRVDWFGPSMSLQSFLTARLMEAWAHGCDIRDALGLPLAASSGLRHIVHLGYITRDHSYAVRGRRPPLGQVAVRLEFPDGTQLCLGDPTTSAAVEGSALDFCLVVTQRRHVDETQLLCIGDLAHEWMNIAQAFAGSPTTTDDRRRAEALASSADQRERA